MSGDTFPWWWNDPGERFWLEATDRQDIGHDLRAPAQDEGGRENWRYSLFKLAKPGDVVLHYNAAKFAAGIIGASVIAGPSKNVPIVWGARGTYAREKGSTARERDGYQIPLTQFTQISSILTLEELRTLKSEVAHVVNELQTRYPGRALYFPFELSTTRPLRLLQGYAFKVPVAFLNVSNKLRPFSGLGGGIQQHEDIVPKAASRNPPWQRDELVLALELYCRSGGNVAKLSPELLELSRFLNGHAAELWGKGLQNLRNPNGVYMKLMNFRRFDPQYTRAGKIGLTRGNKDEEAVWHEFGNNPARLFQVASAIRSALVSAVGRANDDGIIEPEIVEAVEGRVLTRVHVLRERNRKLVSERKRVALSKAGHLSCEACGFDFESRYGERGRGFIECHHVQPVYTLTEGHKTKLEDLALVCSNCHRMIHSTRPWLTVSALKDLLRVAR
jgi:5-methylcytosine-specific restriction enzyme A